MPNRVALIGCGVMGRRHRNAGSARWAKHLTVFDVDAARMQALAERGAVAAGLGIGGGVGVGLRDPQPEYRRDRA